MPLVQNNEKSLCSSFGVEHQAPKRQKLEGGHSLKVYRLSQLSIQLRLLDFAAISLRNGFLNMLEAAYLNTYQNFVVN